MPSQRGEKGGGKKEGKRERGQEPILDLACPIEYHRDMARPPRAAEGGLVYHALNRANARLAIFDGSADYDAFLRVLEEAVVRHEMRLLAYCVMPNHFHLLLWPRADGDLSRFMRWLTLTHTQRWHAHRHSAGSGHLYQGRFKSFPVESDEHFLVACRYVERNALRAGLVDRAEAWRWGSLSQRVAKSTGLGPPLSPWPIKQPPAWSERVNAALSPAEEESLQRSVRRGQPFGSAEWQAATTVRLGLESAFRPRGRPKKGGNGTCL
jgi:putative transposase